MAMLIDAVLVLAPLFLLPLDFTSHRTGTGQPLNEG